MQQPETKPVQPAAPQYVNVVFASDFAYLPYTNVAATSVAEHFSDPERRLRIFLLTDADLPKDHAKRFSDLAKKYDFDFKPIVVNAEKFAHLRTTRGISIATYYRLFMHTLLPKDVKRVAYFDSDLVVTENVTKLFDMVLGPKFFAGAEDYNSVAHRIAYDQPPGSPNINAGVMLVNIIGLRKNNFSQKVEEYIKKNQFRIFHGDQQIINHLFHEQMNVIPIRWNMHGDLFVKEWRNQQLVASRTGIKKNDAARAAEEPCVIHYNGGVKPWEGGAHPKRKIWYKYAKLSTYSDLFVAPEFPKTQKPKPPTFGAKVAKFFGWDKVRLYNFELGRARATRLTVQRMIDNGDIWKEAPHADLRAFSDKTMALQMHQFLLSRGRDVVKQPFTARSFIASLPPSPKVRSNAPNNDLEGGFHENIKPIFQSAFVSGKVLPYEADAMLVLHMALRTRELWDLFLGAQFDKPLLFAEASFFGAYSGYFDKTAPSVAKRPFGYIFDDMCYYYDARQPSRIESILNSDDFALSSEQFNRVDKLIRRAVEEDLTKYNRYSGQKEKPKVPPGSVLVVDQTPSDASIRFGGAERRTISDMIAAAVRENPGKKVYFKRHPDNVIKERYSVQLPHQIEVLPDGAEITGYLDACETVYVVSSQVGFEALIRGKRVVTFGMPFYAGWGLTEDRQPFRRRTAKRSIHDIFHVACIDLSIYVDPENEKIIEIEEAFDMIGRFREMDEGYTRRQSARSVAAASRLNGHADNPNGAELPTADLTKAPANDEMPVLQLEETPASDVTGDYLVCRECGKRLKALPSHLSSQHQLSPGEYKAKWNLPETAPMVIRQNIYAES